MCVCLESAWARGWHRERLWGNNRERPCVCFSQCASAEAARAFRWAHVQATELTLHFAMLQALYQSAVELADACEQKAKVAAQAQHYRLVGLKAAADAIGARVQQLDTTREGGSNVNPPSRG